MKGAVVLMLLVCAGMGVALWHKGDGAMGRALAASGEGGLKLLPILALAVLMMGAFEELLPKQLVQTWLSDAAGWRGIGVAWVAGALTPAGSLVGMPIAAGLLKAGVSASVIVTYLVSMATLSIIRIPMEVGLLGGRITALRVVSCLLLPPLAGLLVRALTARA